MRVGLGLGVPAPGIGHNGGPPLPPFVGPLDAYTANQAIAWSFCRRLRADYTGNILQLRRDSDADEAPFSYLDNGWINLAAIADFRGGANLTISHVFDQSGLGRHGVQTNTAKQPTFLPASSAINSAPCASFGGSQSLQFDAGPGSTFLNGTTAFLVAAMSAPANGGAGFGRIFSAKASSGNDYDQDSSCLLSFDNGGGALAAVRNAGFSTVSRPTDTGFVASGRIDSTQVFAGVNGTEGSGSSESGTFAARYLGMGEIGNSGSSYSAMKMAEALIWNAVPSSDDRAAIIAIEKTLMGVP